MTWRPDGDGSLFVRIKLPVLDGEKLQKVVAAFTTRPAGLDRRLDPDAEPPTLDQRRADGLVTMVDQFFHPHTDARQETDTGTDTGPDAGPSGSPTAGVPPNVSVILHFDDLVAGTGAGTLVDSDEPISAATARRLACQANLVRVVLGRNGEILDVGKAHRLVTPAIRKALTVRDRGCLFPGCDVAPRQCDAHHVIPWHAGGKTGLDNLVLLCRHHHRIVEPDPRKPPGSQWTISIDEHGIPWIRPPIRLDPHRTPHRHARFTE